MTARRLGLCVDDFGGAPGIAEAVERLAAARRVNAVSCLVTAEGWRRDAPRLAALGEAVVAGLHLNLTEGRPLSRELGRVWPVLPRLGALLARAHLGALPTPAVRAEIAAQLEAFGAATGRAPRFVDGHQHVHHLPGVRVLVLEAIAGLAPRPAVRNTGRVLGPGFALKRAVIAGTGGRRLQAALRRGGIAHNAALVGVYDFAMRDYRALIRGWLRSVPAEGALLFCHPGVGTGLDAGDAIAAARARELAYLGSAEFERDCAEAGVALGPAWRVAAPG